MESASSSAAEPLTVVRCPKGMECAHDPDDPMWESPCRITEAYDGVVNNWIDAQWAPSIEAPPGHQWAGTTVVVHQGPVVQFNDLGAKRPVVFTREVKPDGLRCLLGE